MLCICVIFSQLRKKTDRQTDVISAAPPDCLKNKIIAIDGIHLSSQIRLVNVMLAEVQEQQRPTFHCLLEIYRQLNWESTGLLLLCGDEIGKTWEKRLLVLVCLADIQ